jgi:hypothetical protein
MDQVFRVAGWMPVAEEEGPVRKGEGKERKGKIPT